MKGQARLVFVIVACAMLGVAYADAAAGASAPAAQGAAASKTADDEVICKSEVALGSLIPKKVCATRKQWEAIRQDSRDATQQAQRTADQMNPGGH